MNVIVFDVDVEAVLLQQAVHAELQFADVVLDLVVGHSLKERSEKRKCILTDVCSTV